jgi:3-oxoacyl-[acyl-carrier protein] reductase
MDLGIRDRVALVAASSKGLGRGCAEMLAGDGASLVMCARGTDALKQAAAEIRAATGVPVLEVPADLAVPEDVDRVIRAALDEYGHIDILVTNTGGPPAGTFETHDTEAWNDAVHNNLDSVLNLVRGALPGMKERGWGRIINITSIAVKEPVDNLILSNSIRAAVTGFARTLANEVAPHGVTVNNVMPGYTRTDRIEELSQKNAELHGTTQADELAKWERQIPMGRLGEPRELGALVTFLASEKAAYITGTSIAVDGGYLKALI